MVEIADKRRQAGAETRRRLVEAAADALAESGPGAVSLRAVSRAAEANVAAVKYHFGSREALITAALSETMRELSTRQLTALRALADSTADATPREWVEAWARPLVGVATAKSGHERRLGRITGQVLANQVELGQRVRELAAETDALLLDGLGRSLPDIEEPELRLRIVLMAAALAGLASGAFDPLLTRAKPNDDLFGRIIDRLEVIASG